ncbi:hypothetical protein BJV74DRAFT_989857 [Russula compacta]|nr:hypothetical protein BJV74DRAFT_989857 [Russula compacta]
MTTAYCILSFFILWDIQGPELVLYGIAGGNKVPFSLALTEWRPASLPTRSESPSLIHREIRGNPQRQVQVIQPVAISVPEWGDQGMIGKNECVTSGEFKQGGSEKRRGRANWPGLGLERRYGTLEGKRGPSKNDASEQVAWGNQGKVAWPLKTWAKEEIAAHS